MPILEIERLSVSYHGERSVVAAVDMVDVTVDAGEIVGIVGQTGCGKTTLARTVLGTLPRGQATVIGGTIKVDGREVAADPMATGRRAHPTVSFVPQDTYASLNPLFRIGSQIADIMRYAGSGEATGRTWLPARKFYHAVFEIFDAVRLPRDKELLRRYPHELSGGQRQRLMLAMALLARPKLIIADEPTSALDGVTQVQILSLFRKVAAEQKVGILFATHNLGAAWEICDRILVMHGGRVIENATRERFFSGPRHPYSRELVATATEVDRKPPWAVSKSENLDVAMTGCKFCATCPHRTDLCEKVRPLLEGEKIDHTTACHNPWTGKVAFA